VQVVDREILATTGRGGMRSQELQRGEFVLASSARGCIGAVSTSERFLTISSQRGGWREARYRVGEEAPESIQIGDTLALVATNRRVIAFDALRDKLVEARLSPQETVLDGEVGDNVVAVATQRRLIGFVPGLKKFMEHELRINEPVHAMMSTSDSVTVTTPYRILVLRSGGTGWSERSR
jgi:hypothetical protein